MRFFSVMTHSRAERERKSAFNATVSYSWGITTAWEHFFPPLKSTAYKFRPFTDQRLQPAPPTLQWQAAPFINIQRFSADIRSVSEVWLILYDSEKQNKP